MKQIVRDAAERPLPQAAMSVRARDNEVGPVTSTSGAEGVARLGPHADGWLANRCDAVPGEALGNVLHLDLDPGNGVTFADGDGS